MKWAKPHGLAICSSLTVDIEEPVYVDGYWWKEKDRPPMTVEDVEVCHLDPGGMAIVGAEWREFLVDDYRFCIKLYNVSDVMYLAEHAVEFQPGCRTIFVYPGMAVTMTAGLMEKLIDKLMELSRSDEVVNAELDMCLIKAELDEHPNIDMGIKKEMPGDGI